MRVQAFVVSPGIIGNITGAALCEHVRVGEREKVRARARE